ncbi:hypothetical protein [Prevotella sp. P5-64]|nr:hypothetical protein [Prevotella sp. P5-64]
MKSKISEEMTIALPIAVCSGPVALIIFLPHQPTMALRTVTVPTAY